MGHAFDTMRRLGVNSTTYGWDAGAASCLTQ